MKKELKISCPVLFLIPRQLDLVRDLVLNSRDILLDSIGFHTYKVTFIYNEDMFAIIDLLKETGLWYGENDWKYYKTGI